MATIITDAQGIGKSVADHSKWTWEEFAPAAPLMTQEEATTLLTAIINRGIKKTGSFSISRPEQNDAVVNTNN